MSKEILQKVIEKATKNKFIPNYYGIETKWFTRGKKKEFKGFEIIDFDLALPIIFTHEFAKAFWKGRVSFCPVCEVEIKEALQKCGCDDEHNRDILADWDAWRYHLEGLVLSKNRIKYLKQFLKKS